MSDHKGHVATAGRQDTPWPLVEVLQRLADAADHLLRDHDCDAQGWEGVSVARDRAREIAREIQAEPAASGPSGPPLRGVEALREYAEDLRSVTWLAPVSATEMTSRDRWLADELDAIADSIEAQAMEKEAAITQAEAAAIPGSARPLEVDEAMQRLELALYGKPANTWERSRLERVQAVVADLLASRKAPDAG